MRHLTNRILGVFLLTFSLGVLATIMHSEYKFWLCNIGATGSAIFVVLRFILKENKSTSDYLKYPAIAVYIFGRAFSINHLNFSYEISIASLIMLISWYVWQYFEAEENGSNLFSLLKSPLLKIAVAMILIAALFKVLHWPFANVIMIISFLPLFAWITKKFIIEGR